MIHQPVELEMIESDTSLTPIIATLIYDESDPLAVEIDFLDQGRPTRWTVGRDHLSRSLGAPEPEQHPDVSVWSCRDGLHIRLDNGTHVAHLHTNVGPVAMVLALSYILVPQGTEMSHVDLDGELLSLLGGAA